MQINPRQRILRHSMFTNTSPEKKRTNMRLSKMSLYHIPLHCHGQNKYWAKWFLSVTLPQREQTMGEVILNRYIATDKTNNRRKQKRFLFVLPSIILAISSFGFPWLIHARTKLGWKEWIYGFIDVRFSATSSFFLLFPDFQEGRGRGSASWE